MGNSLIKPLIDKSITEIRPQNIKVFEKKIKKYEGLIESEIDTVKNSDKYNILTGHTFPVTSIQLPKTESTW